MAKHVFRLERAGEPTLRCAVWQPTTTPRGTVLITQGYAENVERYDHVAEMWSHAGFAVGAYDLRGQGLSLGRRGHVDRFGDFTGDLNAVLSTLHAEHGWQQFGASILFGHSLGGLISTVAALEQPQRFLGLGLASPFWGLALKPAAWKVYAGRLLTNLWPTYKDRSEIALDLLTHDASRVAIMQKDTLRFDTVTARWFTETEAAQARVSQEFQHLPLRVFCQAAGDDHVADVATTRRVFASSNNPEHLLEVKAGQYHELHQETDRIEYLTRFQTAFERWLDKR